MTEEIKRKKWGSAWIYISSIVVVGVGLWFLLKGKAIPLHEIREALERFEAKWVWLALGSICVQILWQICRLWVLVPSKFPISFLRISRIFVWCQFVNSFAPARAGDFMKAFALSNKKYAVHLSVPEAAGVLIADKIIDASSLFLLCFIAGITNVADLPSFPPIPWKVAAGIGVTLGILLTLPFFVPKWKLRLQKLKGRFLEGVRAFFRNPCWILIALIFSTLCWVFESLAVNALCEGQASAISFGQAVMVLLTLNVGIAVPIAVANIGAFEAAMTFGLTRAGVAPAAALAVSTVHHAFQIAGIAVWLLGLGFLKILYKEKSEKPTLLA